MTLDLWLAYVGTVLVLMSSPGPSQLLMLSNSMGSGFRRALATAAGDLSANFLQMIVASAGLAGLVVSSGEFFRVAKWAGVGYLVFLGLRMWRATPTATATEGEGRRSARSLYWQGFLTSAANPKAIIFFAALFPQFLDLSEALVPQFAILSATYLTIDGAFLATYGKGAEWFSSRLRGGSGRILGRVSGSLLIGAAVLLGLKDLEPR